MCRFFNLKMALKINIKFKIKKNSKISVFVGKLLRNFPTKTSSKIFKIIIDKKNKKIYNKDIEVEEKI